MQISRYQEDINVRNEIKKKTAPRSLKLNDSAPLLQDRSELEASWRSGERSSEAELGICLSELSSVRGERQTLTAGTYKTIMLSDVSGTSRRLSAARPAGRRINARIQGGSCNSKYSGVKIPAPGFDKRAARLHIPARTDTADEHRITEPVLILLL